MNSPINLDILYGHIEIRTEQWREGDDLVMGGYSITYGRNGQETSRTKCEENCRLTDWYAPESWAPRPAINWPAVAWCCAAAWLAVQFLKGAA